jgi:hypothetical protein
MSQDPQEAEKAIAKTLRLRGRPRRWPRSRAAPC